MIDDAEQLLHGTVISSTTVTCNSCQRRCQCNTNTNLSQQSAEKRTITTCCHCCCHCCCSCSNAKSRVTQASPAIDLLAQNYKQAEQKNRDMNDDEEAQQKEEGEDKKEEEEEEEETAISEEKEKHAVPFEVEAHIVEYRQKGNNNDTTNYLPMTAVEEELDTGLRYSFKGIPPDTYSAKKEFIYTRPLVEKQVRSRMKKILSVSNSNKINSHSNEIKKFIAMLDCLAIE